MARIIVDMDDTLCDLNKNWLKKYNALANDSLTKEQIRGWSIDSYVKPEWRAEPFWKGKFFQLLTDEGFFMWLDPIPGAVETLTSWHEQGHEIIIATMAINNDPNIIEGKKLWLEECLPWFDHANLVFTARKYLLRADAMVDDNVEFLRQFWGSRIMFSQPWNEDVSRRDFSHYRVHTWNQADRRIRELFPLGQEKAQKFNAALSKCAGKGTLKSGSTIEELIEGDGDWRVPH